ncbi:MAG TPA: transposase [Opitutus sp.]|nr:transposase [Opitutus sp.]
MSLPTRRWLYHTPPAWARDATFFITICCQRRGPNQLCTPTVSEKLLRSIRHYHETQRWYVCLWLLMPDHLHALVSCPRQETLAKVIGAWKRFTARDAGTAWQRGFFDHRLRHDESFEEKARYIRLNPVRKALVARPEDWPHFWQPER